MKKLILKIVVLLLFTFSLQLSTLLAQAPQAFKYQAVVRDNAGNVLINHVVNFKISILKSSASGTAVYVETQKDTTNAFGLANLKIGNGTFVSGNFSTINWGNDEYFVKIEFDVNGGSSFQLMGTSQLLSVPYALYAEKAGDGGLWTKNGSNIYPTDTIGNIGIGTTNPMVLLNVKKIAGGNIALIQDSSKGVLLQTLSTSAGIIGYNGSNYNNLDIRATSGEGSGLYLTSTGNIGIGTTVPSGILQVFANNTDANLFYIHQAKADGGSAVLVDIKDDRGFSYSNTGTTFRVRSWNYHNDLNEALANFVTIDGGTDISRLYINNVNGNVGIGTTNPTNKLSVNGTIQAKEVIVNTGWSDFVFDKGYKLMSLAELEKFINKNKHLPNISSAADVEKNGLSLGNSNAKLLQTIEEQMLYIIDINKRLEKVEKENAELKVLINKIK